MPVGWSGGPPALKHTASPLPIALPYPRGFVGCWHHGELFKRLHPRGTLGLHPSGQAPREGHTIVVSIRMKWKVLTKCTQVLSESSFPLPSREGPQVWV